MKGLLRVGGGFFVFLHAIGGLYAFLISPPIHLFYDIKPPAGNSTIYVPGGGFSGFWFHLGLFQSLPGLDSFDYYCYSSGCLSLLLAFMNTTVDTAFDTCHDIQTSWKKGDVSSFEMVNLFLDRLVPKKTEQLHNFLPRINVLVTTASRGAEVHQPSSREELVDLMVKTTWIPFVTGQGILKDENDERFLDGGFSRRLHPKCQHSAFVPNTWSTFIHTLNPGFGRRTAYELFEMGQSHSLLESR